MMGKGASRSSGAMSRCAFDFQDSATSPILTDQAVCGGPADLIDVCIAICSAMHGEHDDTVTFP